MANGKVVEIARNGRLIVSSVLNEDTKRKFKPEIKPLVSEVLDSAGKKITQRYMRDQVIIPWFTAEEIAAGLKGFIAGLQRLDAKWTELYAAATQDNEVSIATQRGGKDASKAQEVMTRKYNASYIPGYRVDDNGVSSINLNVECFEIFKRGAKLGIQGPMNQAMVKKYTVPAAATTRKARGDEDEVA